VIYWSEFTWEAFATLATGLAAVIAAWNLGRKQTKIQQAQVEIQNLTLRSELFDRRYKLCEATRTFLLKIFVLGGEGQLSLTADWTQNFLHALQEARILFSSNVFIGMDEVWKKAVDYSGLQEEMARTFREAGHYGEGNPARQREGMIWFGKRMETLPDLFEELNLGTLAGSDKSPSKR
jgi:hypothetical protein